VFDEVSAERRSSSTSWGIEQVLENTFYKNTFYSEHILQGWSIYSDSPCSHEALRGSKVGLVPCSHEALRVSIGLSTCDSPCSHHALPKWCTAELGRLPDRHGAWP
jgi:hypothetical protein